MPTTANPTPTPRPYAPPSGTRSVLPCHPLHHGGYYEYVLIDVAQARTWLQAGPYVSCLDVGTAAALSRLTGVKVRSGHTVRLAAEDDALVFVLAEHTLGWVRRLA